MTVYLPPPLITDAATLKRMAIETMEAELPGWTTEQGSIEDIELQAVANLLADQAQVVASELTGVYRSLGPLVSTPPIEPVAATAIATFTMVDNKGYTIEAGAIVGIRDASGELQGFQLPARLKVPGVTIEATLVALEPGTASNNLEGEAELVSVPASVVSVTLATSGGGVDAEEEESFLDRLTEAFALQRPGPVIAQEAASLARSVPGIFRATAVNLLKPGGSDGGEGGEETNVEKCVTVAVRGDGADATSEQRAAVDALLQEEREVNFKFFVVKPHYLEIDVTTTVSAWPGLSLTVVKEAVEEALAVFLDPDRYATDATGKPEHWAYDNTLRQSELYAAVSNTPGVRFCSALTFAQHGKTLATTDVALSGTSAIPALPVPATFSVTVNAST